MVLKSVLAVALLLCHVAGGSNKVLLTDPTSKLSKYTLVTPQRVHRLARSAETVTSAQRDERETLTYSLNINEQKHILHLKRNNDFLSKNFVHYSHGTGGKYKAAYPKHHDHCYYHGQVEGHADSHVALSTCSGLRGVIILEQEVYGLEPAPRSMKNEHILYLLKDVQSEPFVCGVANETLSSEGHAPFDPTHSISQLLRRKRNLPDTRYVELVLVVDNQRYKFKGENETAVREEMVRLANLLDGYYKMLNIRVVLVGLEVFTVPNPFSVEGAPGEVLGRFVEWRRTKLLPRIRNDIGQLVVGRPTPYEGNVLGMAFVGTVCSTKNGGGINVFSDDRLESFSTIMAHEMGHNLGMRHDRTDSCKCDGKPCIMAPFASNSISFSTCSASDFERLANQGGGECLKNQPSHTDVVGIAQCGNGMLEDGEQCDCGTPQECRNKCCDPATCTLTRGAACAHGSCCRNCQILVSGEPCRRSVNTCDLPEFCNGTSPFCPEDFYIMDGLSCENNAAYCYEGRCQTYDYQCKRIFEQDASKAADVCYRHINTEGTKFGNCGPHSPGKYNKCTVDNAMCGKVHCTNVDANHPPPGATASIRYVEGSKCVNADFDLGSDMLDPGYANPGSPCATGKTCVDFHCVNASSIRANLDCDAQGTCNGNGVCNDQGHCHCNNGWAPPRCDRAGRGGSIDSGPAQIDHSLRDGLLIFFLLVLPVLTLIILLMLYIFRRDSLLALLKRKPAGRHKSYDANNGQAATRAPEQTHQATQLPGNQPSFSNPDGLHGPTHPADLDHWNTSPPHTAPIQGPGVPRPIPKAT